MYEVDISEVESFRDHARLQSLNRLVEINTTLSADFIAGYTNCHVDDALYILFVLLNLDVAEGFTLIYDSNNFRFGLIDRRPFTKGLPELPYKYGYMDQGFKIERIDEMFIIFEFDLKENLRFITHHE